jgi:hypothetical protein
MHSRRLVGDGLHTDKRRMEMALQDELNALKTKSEARIPAEKLAVIHRATEDLEKSGLKDRVLKAGDRAPDFALNNTEGILVSSRALLNRGPMVLSFYRGGW